MVVEELNAARLTASDKECSALAGRIKQAIIATDQTTVGHGIKTVGMHLQDSTTLKHVNFALPEQNFGPILQASRLNSRFSPCASSVGNFYAISAAKCL